MTSSTGNWQQSGLDADSSFSDVCKSLMSHSAATDASTTPDHPMSYYLDVSPTDHQLKQWQITIFYKREKNN